jgi:hypothetical protein
VATLIGPDLKATEVPLAQVGTGQYEARADLSQPGTYLVRVGVSEGQESIGQQTLGLVVPYSPEYRASGTDRTLLGELAERTGGSELLEPLMAFLHNLPAADRAREVWQALLLLAALLFPLDVAVRRVMLGSSDLRKALAWVQQRLPTRRSQAARQERVLGQLFRARDRVRARTTRGGGTVPEAGAPPSPAALGTEPATGTSQDESPTPEERPTRPQDEGEDLDSLARLRRAKGRARR